MYVIMHCTCSVRNSGRFTWGNQATLQSTKGFPWGIIFLLFSVTLPQKFTKAKFPEVKSVTRQNTTLHRETSYLLTIGKVALSNHGLCVALENIHTCTSPTDDFWLGPPHQPSGLTLLLSEPKNLVLFCSLLFDNAAVHVNCQVVSSGNVSKNPKL